MTRTPSPDSAAPADAVRLALGGQTAGLRLDRFLVDALALSRSQARELLASGAVRLGGRTLGYADKGLSLPGEGTLEVADFRRPEERRPRAAAGGGGPGLSVLAEGPGWIAVDKPAGAPVHPLSEDEPGSVLSAVASRYPSVHGVGEGGLRSGILHRLDVDTSGVLLFATEQAAWERLRGAFQAHRVEKRYRAIVAGDFPEAGTGAMRCELAVARHRPARVRVVDGSWSPRRAYPARQQVTVLERFGDATLLEVAIETGFLHQIRVILAHRGFPVLGDALYGDERALGHGVPRQMLHAAHLQFEDVEASSPDPEDFAQVLESLRAAKSDEESDTCR